MLSNLPSSLKVKTGYRIGSGSERITINLRGDNKMTLLSQYSAVAGKQLHNMEDVANFFIREDFMEKFHSIDVDFAIAYEALTGKEARYPQARKAFQLLKGVTPTYNGSEMGLASRLEKFKKAFQPSPVRITKATEVDGDVLKMVMTKSFLRSYEKLSSIPSYLNNVVMTEDGLQAMNNYFVDGKFFQQEIGYLHGDKLTEISTTLYLGKEEFKVLLCRLIVQNENLYQGQDFTNHQKKSLNTFIKTYLSDYDLGDEELQPSLSESEIKSYFYHYEHVPTSGNLPPEFKGFSILLLKQLKYDLVKGNTDSVLSLCQLARLYKEFIIRQSFFSKSEEAVKKEEHDSIMDLQNTIQISNEE